MPVLDTFIQQTPGLLVGAATATFAFLGRRLIERRREVDSLDIEKRTAELHVLMKEEGLTLDDLAALRATLTGGASRVVGPIREVASQDVDPFIRENLFPRWFQWVQGFCAVYWGLTLTASIIENNPLTARSAALLGLQGGLLLLAIRELVEPLGRALGNTDLVRRFVRKRLLPHMTQADVE